MRETSLPAAARRPLPKAGASALTMAHMGARRAGEPTLEDFLLYGVLAAAAFAPLWFGGNRPFAWGVNAVAWSALVIAHEMALSLTGRSYPVSPIRLAPMLALMGGLLVWTLMQSAPLVPEWLHNPVWALTAASLHVPVAGAVSMDPDATRLALLTLVPPAAAFWLALQLGREGRRARRIVLAVAAITTLYAAYAILSFIWLPDRLLWVKKEFYLDAATGPFVNRNSYATYAAIGLLASLSALSGAIARAHDAAASWKGWLTVMLTRRALLPGLLLCAVMLNGIALMLTGSRAGIAAGLLGVLAYCALITSRSGFRWPQAAGLGAAALVILLVVTQHDDLLSQRLHAQGIVDDVRLAILRLGMSALGDQPWTGFGFGTFEDAFRLYRDASLPGALTIDKAHNTYLELALGLGLPGFLLLMAAMLLLFARCARGGFVRRKDAEIPLLATAVTLMVAIHALVDFSLQIQGVAITYALLLGVGVSQSWPSDTSPRRAREATGPC